MKRLLLFYFLLFFARLAFAQNARFSAPFPSVSQTTPPFLIANLPPNSPVLAVCNVPANGTPCTNYATTYNSAGVACPNGAQDTPDPQPSNCQSTGDAQGNIGFFVPQGSYDYTVCVSTNCFGPYRVTVLGAPSGTLIATATGWSGRFVLLYADSGTGPVAEGTGQAPGSFLNGAGSQAGVSATPTATESPGRSFTSDASASTNLKAGTNQGGGAGLGADWTTFGNYLRMSMRLLLFNTTNVRYWIGITDFATGDMSGSGLATDTPNRSYCMFRFSAGTDTTFKAVCGTATASQTVVNTGVAPQTTNSVLFEIVPSSSNVLFYINGALVATITTTMPAQGDRVSVAWTADNKNTATAVGATFYSALYSLK